MTHFAGFTTAGALKITTALAPATAMGVKTTGAADGTVTLQTDIATGVAGLAGGQTAACFAGMITLPIVEAGGHIPLHVAGVTVGFRSGFTMDHGKVFAAPKVTEKKQMRWTVGPVGAANASLEIAVTIGTEAWLVTAGAGLLIAAGGQGVGDMEITGVTVHHIVAEGTLLIGKTGDVTLHTVALGVAGVTIHSVPFGHGAMVARPHGTMGVDGAEGGHFDIRLVMTHEAGFGRGDNTGGAFHVAGAALHAVGIFLEMGIMIKAHPLRPRGGSAEQEQCEQKNR